MKFSREDLLIGFFIIFGISYPFITALLIFLEDIKTKREELEELRSFYTFLLGLEECKEEKAKEISKLMSEELYKELGGEMGLLKLCQTNKKDYPSAKAEEKEFSDGKLEVELLKKEKGMVQRFLSVKLYFEGEGEDLKIKRIEYEKRN